MAALLIAVMGAGCFDAPVRQRVELFFDADGSVEIRVVTAIVESWRDTRNPRVRDRIATLRESLLGGEDLWARAIREMEPERERVAHDYEKGELISSTRQARAEKASAVERLFAGTPVGAVVTEEEGTVSFDLLPGRSGAATSRQERRVAEAVGSFSAAVARYLDALGALYVWLDSHPEAAGKALAILMGSDEGRPDDGEMAPEGKRLLAEAERIGDEVSGVLDIGNEDAYTLDELSRLVHDPFPAPISVEVNGDILEVEGFLVGDGRRFTTRSHSLWDALAGIESRWVEPIPLIAAVSAIRRAGDAEDVDEDALLETLLASPRRVHGVPSEAEVREAIEAELRPPDLYHLRWKPPGPDAEEVGEEAGAR